MQTISLYCTINQLASNLLPWLIIKAVLSNPRADDWFQVARQCWIILACHFAMSTQIEFFKFIKCTFLNKQLFVTIKSLKSINEVSNALKRLQCLGQQTGEVLRRFRCWKEWQYVIGDLKIIFWFFIMHIKSEI